MVVVSLLEWSFRESDVRLSCWVGVSLDVCSVDKTGCEAIITQRALVFLSAVASRFRSCGGSAENFVIKQHNNKVLSTPAARPKSGCNCRKKDQCPLSNNCLTPSLIYRAHVKTDTDPTGKSYIGLTEGPFKQRYNNHTLSFRDRKRENSTELSKYVWKLKDEHTSYKIHWTILAKAAAYNNKTKRCNLCLTEKLHIIRADTSTLLNKRSELISKCRHENKFLLKNLS